ncbi:MAG: hypothetical protein [Olavius algarvensis Gamma 1 endosymbiont]|nr:MAG: hypothetical protein [Olavius algarvensis Gamma 1 endosymbiont]
MNRLPRQLRPEWVVTPCRRLLASAARQGSAKREAGSPR